MDHTTRLQRAATSAYSDWSSYRRTETLIVLRDEAADTPLHGNIEADRRFIQKDDLRTVQKRGSDFALHSFAQRQVAHGLVSSGPNSTDR